MQGYNQVPSWADPNAGKPQNYGQPVSGQPQYGQNVQPQAQPAAVPATGIPSWAQQPHTAAVAPLEIEKPGHGTQPVVVKSQRRNFCIGVTIGVLVLIGVIVGVSVGLTTQKTNNSDDNSSGTSVESSMGATLPVATKTTIDALVTSSDQRVSAYVSANVVLSTINTLKSSNASTLYSDISTLRDDLLRAAECAMYMSEGDYSTAMSLLATASYSAISSDEDARAYLGATNDSIPNSFTLTTSSEAMYGTSCDYLVNKQLNTTSVVVSSHVRTRRMAEKTRLRGFSATTSSAEKDLNSYGDDDDVTFASSSGDDDDVTFASSSGDDVSSSGDDDVTFASGSGNDDVTFASSSGNDDVTFVSGTCSQTNIDMIYVNGICATPCDIAAGATALNTAVQRLGTAKSVSVEAFPNPSNTWFCGFDLLEVLLQKVEETNGSEEWTISDVVKFIQSWPIVRAAEESGNTAIDALKAKLSSIYGYAYLEDVLSTFTDHIAAELEQFHQVATTTSQLADKIENSVFHGKAVIVVAHSQGNLYMNAAYQSLTDSVKPYVQLMSVATPAAYVGTSGVYTPYVTRTDDKVINSLRLTSSVLLSNVVPSESSWFGLNHFFVSDYLMDANTKSQVISKISTLVSNAQQNAAQASSGPITVTMTWGAQPDLDMHIFEPNGRHVYYSSKIGLSGYLDVDDTSSYGPENYFVGANTLELGTYEIGVNYYSGSGPDSAHFYIQTCTSVREYDQPVYTDLGSSGNANPIMVAKVTVSMDEYSNSPTFVIESM